MSDAIARLNAALEGSYRIESELGQGGMATVYLASDLKHERRVALKVLKPELAAVLGADRFLAEIKTTANLQHPHILPLHDSGEADGFLYYVMPYVEGETLRERIDRDKQLPVDEALGIATAVANALHTAHLQGVVHRDIKPGNILMSQGQPLVADFGIALAVNAGGSGRLTETGLSLGTPYYMSPEQATGDQVVGPASDTFALACVLYEMLVGEPPYPGTTAQAVLGKIIQGLPVSATAIRHSVPANVDAAIRKALEKLPADRFSTAQAFAKALADPGFRHGETDAGGVAGGMWNRMSVAATVAAAVFALTTAWALFRPGPPPPPRSVERFAVPFFEEQEPSSSWNGAFALSPDGTMLVYRKVQDGGAVLMVRRWDDLTATPLRESEGHSFPKVSPDGTRVAFTRAAEVKVAAFSGGPVRTLASGRLSVWGRDDFVYVAVDSGTVRIPPEGGAPKYVSRLADGDRAQWVDDVLPGGRGALLGVELEDGTDEIRVLDLRSGEMTPLAPGSRAKYVPSGHLVYRAEDGTMMAARFDPDRMELLGTPVAVMDGVVA
jgi:serine/threonine-protein kinase